MLAWTTLGAGKVLGANGLVLRLRCLEVNDVRCSLVSGAGEFFGAGLNKRSRLELDRWSVADESDGTLVSLSALMLGGCCFIRRTNTSTGILTPRMIKTVSYALSATRREVFALRFFDPCLEATWGLRS